MKVTVDTAAISKLASRAAEEIAKVPAESYEYFKKITPKRSGNAQRNTFLRGNDIVADYAYAGRLDEGYSDKAPDGMTEPTEKYIEEKIMPDVVRRITNGQ